MKFFENFNPKGHLEIWVHKPNSEPELHFSDPNVICSGMGLAMSNFFTAPLQENVENYQLSFFQVGVSGWAGNQVSSTGELSSALTRVQYGSGALDISTHSLYNNGVVTADQAFGVIPKQYVRKVAPEKVMWQIVLDQNTANIGEGDSATPLNEIGLFAKDPFHGGNDPDQSVLCAYRYFKPIYKTDAITVVFRWTVEF